MIFDVFDELKMHRSVTKHDGIMLIYNFAVVFSGGYAVLTFDIPDRWTLMGLTMIFAIFWTVYFKFAMFRRFIDHPRLEAKSDTAAETGND